MGGSKPRKREDWWRLIGIHLMSEGYELPEWREFGDLDEDQLKARWDEAKAIRPLRESIPDWLDKVCEEQLGEELWTPTLAALNPPQPGREMEAQPGLHRPRRQRADRHPDQLQPVGEARREDGLCHLFHPPPRERPAGRYLPRLARRRRVDAGAQTYLLAAGGGL